VEIAKDTFIPLEDLIAHHLDTLFPGMHVVSHNLFRVTRDADFEVSDETEDLLAQSRMSCVARRFGEVVRLEVDADIEAGIRERLIDWLDVAPEPGVRRGRMLDLTDLWQIVGIEDHSELRQQSWTPQTHPPSASELTTPTRRRTSSPRCAT